LALKTKEAEIAKLKQQIHHLTNEALLLRDELATARSEISCSRHREAELKTSNASLQESLSMLDANHNKVSDKLETTLSSLEGI
jgi:predicted nuclease with TOPRIM domain